MTQLYNIVPTPATGIELNPNEGAWSIILPEETTNLVTNPSFERSLDSWSAPLSTIVVERSNFRSKRGAWSAVVSTSPANYTDAANDHYVEHSLSGWEAGQPLTVSADGWTNSFSESGKANRIGILIDAVETLSEPITQEITWERLSITVVIPSGTTTVDIRLYLGQAMANPDDIILTTYWDGVQAEQKHYVTTYADGDQRGLVNDLIPYRWLGIPHASKSKRSAKTKNGGRIINFNDIDYRIFNYSGSGLTGFDDISLDYALIEGELYRRTIGQSRILTLAGFICGKNEIDLKCKIQDLQNLLKPNIATQNGQLLLRYTSCECDEELDIVVSYLGGMEGDYTNHWQQNLGLRFKAHQPFFIKSGDNGGAIEFLKSIEGNLRIIRKNENGEWAGIDNATFQSGFAFNLQKVGFIGSDIFFAIEGLYQIDIDDNITTWQSLGGVDNFALLSNDQIATNLSNPSIIPAVPDDSQIWILDAPLSATEIGNWTNDTNGIYNTIGQDNQGQIHTAGTRGDIRRWSGVVPVIAGPSNTDVEWPQIVDNFIGEIKQLAWDNQNNLYAVGLFDTPFGSTVTETTEKNINFQAKPTATPETIGQFQFDAVLVNQTIALDPASPTLDFCARVDRIPDGRSITTYTWTVEYDLLTSFTGECVTLTMTEPGGWTDPAVKIFLQLTLDDGSTAEKCYHFKRVETIIENEPPTPNDTEISYEAVSGLDNGQITETLTLDLKPDYCRITTENDVCEGDTETGENGVDEDDPVVSWLWENSIDAQSSTNEEDTFVLNPALGDTFTITLTTATQSGQTNVNTITYEYIDGELLTITATDVVTYYTLTYTNTDFRPFKNAVFLKDGQWNDFGEVIGDTEAIEFDGQQVYLGGIYGVKKFDGGSLTDVGNLSAVRALKFKDGTLYAINNQNAWRFNGSLWQPLGLSYPNDANLISIDVSDADEIVVGAITSGANMSASATTEINYNGDVEARPGFEIVGPGRLWYITNHTTNRTIFIDYSLQDGERVTIELEQSIVSISSNLTGAISFLPGSRADWHLADGSNFIELWITGSNGDTKATVLRRQKFHSINGLCCGVDDEARFEYVPPVLCCDNDPALALQNVTAPYPPPCNDGGGGFNVGSTWFDSGTGKWYFRVTG